MTTVEPGSQTVPGTTMTYEEWAALDVSTQLIMACGPEQISGMPELEPTERRKPSDVMPLQSGNGLNCCF